MSETRRRIEMTVSCHDCDGIPKHSDAGKILEEDGRRIEVMHNGIRVVGGGYGAAWTEEIIARLRGHHEPQEELVFHELLKRLPPTATMIELGGHWSYYSLWFLGEAPDQRRAIVIEPDPNNLSAGRANAALNGRKIEFLQASIGESSSPGEPIHTETAGVLNLPQVTLSELFDVFGIDRLDLLHCDTQGAELGVIRSSLDLFRQGRVGYVVFSTHGHLISGDPLTHQTCLALLESAGAKIIAEHDVHESYSGDGLIAACFGGEADACPTVPISYNRYSTSLFRNPLFDFAESRSALSRVNRHLADRERERNLLEIEIAEAVRLSKERAEELAAVAKALAASERDLAAGEQERLRLAGELETREQRQLSLERDIAALAARHEEQLSAAIHERTKRDRERSDLLDQLAAAQSALRETSAQVDRWWGSADRAIRELARLKGSWSWRATRPFREVARAGRSLRKLIRPSPARQVHPAPTNPIARIRRRRFSRAEIDRFVERQGRSIRKRVRRLRGLPPEIVRRPPAAYSPYVPNANTALSDEAQLILAQIVRRRELAGRPVEEPGRGPE